jgi:hypothetical protein
MVAWIPYDPVLTVDELYPAGPAPKTIIQDDGAMNRVLHCPARERLATASADDSHLPGGALDALTSGARIRMTGSLSAVDRMQDAAIEPPSQARRSPGQSLACATADS